MTESEIWNKLELRPPEPLVMSATVTPILKDKILKLRQALMEPKKVLSNMQTLEAEAKALSLFLYKNYQALKKDKGIQHLKIILTSLKKYAAMDVARSVQFVYDELPKHFPALSLKVELPTRGLLRWLLARIQALAALFYRIYHLSKRAGRFLYGRIRLLWNPLVLFLCLGITARIFCTARFLVLECVKWHSSICSFVQILPKSLDDPYKNHPEDLKEWLGGLSDVAIPVKKTASSLNQIFDLIDLTKENEDDEDFIEIINDFGGFTVLDDEVKHICDVVTNIDAVEMPDEDIGQPVDEKFYNDGTILLDDSPEIVNLLDTTPTPETLLPGTMIENSKPTLKKLKKKRKQSQCLSHFSTDFQFGNEPSFKKKRKETANMPSKDFNRPGTLPRKKKKKLSPAKNKNVAPSVPSPKKKKKKKPNRPSLQLNKMNAVLPGKKKKGKPKGLKNNWKKKNLTL